MIVRGVAPHLWQKPGQWEAYLSPLGITMPEIVVLGTSVVLQIVAAQARQYHGNEGSVAPHRRGRRADGSPPVHNIFQDRGRAGKHPAGPCC